MAEWVESAVQLTYYKLFEGRTTLNIDDGRLEINKSSPADAGIFTLEVNDNVPLRFKAQLIDELLKLEVWVRPLACNHEAISCSLSCDGDTSRAGPVTYSWKLGDKDWVKLGKNVTIKNNETMHGIVDFSCRATNPVSERASNSIPNPFYEEDTSGTSNQLPVDTIIISCGAILIFVIPAIVFVVCRRRQLLELCQQVRWRRRREQERREQEQREQVQRLQTKDERQPGTSNRPPETTGLKSTDGGEE